MLFNSYEFIFVFFLPILLGSIIVNFLIAKHLAGLLNVSSFRKKLTLLSGVAFNLLLLGYFKYADFFINSVNHSIDSNFNLLHLALPSEDQLPNLFLKEPF